MVVNETKIGNQKELGDGKTVNGDTLGSLGHCMCRGQKMKQGKLPKNLLQLCSRQNFALASFGFPGYPGTSLDTNPSLAIAATPPLEESHQLCYWPCSA